MHYAIEGGHTDIVQLLISSGSDVNRPDQVKTMFHFLVHAQTITADEIQNN